MALLDSSHEPYISGGRSSGFGLCGNGRWRRVGRAAEWGTCGVFASDDAIVTDASFLNNLAYMPPLKFHGLGGVFDVFESGQQGFYESVVSHLSRVGLSSSFSRISVFVFPRAVGAIACSFYRHVRKVVVRDIL